MARDGQGRFVRTGDEEEEPEGEPEAEPEGSGLAPGQAVLRAAIAGRIEASERRQAIEARLTRATAGGAGVGAGPSIGGEGEAQRPLDLVEVITTPPSTQNAPGSERVAAAAGGVPVVSVDLGAGARGGVLAARLNDVRAAVQSSRFGSVLDRREVRAAADAELAAIISLIEERLDPLLERWYATPRRPQCAPFARPPSRS